MESNQRASHRRWRNCGAVVAAAVAALVLGGSYPVSAVAQQGAARANDSSDSDRDCLGLREIERTDVVDNDTVLFYLRDGDVYRNDLPYACPELKSEDRFLYRVPQDQLCHIDTITVLRDEGFGFRAGASCTLGVFKPIDPDAAAQLLEQHKTK